MHYLIVQHTMEDYGKWRPVFDAHEGVRQTYGVRDAQVFRNVENPNELLLKFRVDSVERAQKLAHSQELKDAMADAGVVGIPEVFFVESE